MKEEKNILAAKFIVDLAEGAGLPGKLNTWADILKFVMLACSIIVLIAGFCNLPSAIGWVMIISAILQGFFAFLYVHLLRACAVVTEAASIFVLEHKGDNNLKSEENKKQNVQQEENLKQNVQQEENLKPFEVGEEVIVIKSGISTTIKEIKGDEIFLSNGIFGDTFKVSASEIKHKK